MRDMRYFFVIKMKTLNHKEFSRRGGLATLASHGREFYSIIGKKGADTKLKKYGVEYFRKLSILGVEARKKKSKK